MLRSIPVDDTVDVIGIVRSVSPLVPIISKQTHKQLTKRVFVLMDKSLLSVEVTLWGEKAEKYGDDLLHQVIVVKACKVSGYGSTQEKGALASPEKAVKSRALSTIFGSRVFINPDLDQTKLLREWFDATGKDVTPELISLKNTGSGGIDPRKSFQQLKVENLGLTLDPTSSFFFISRCTPIFFRHDNDKPPWYNACPTPECNRKVILNESTREWRCEKCRKNYPSPSPRYILSVHAVDATGDIWLTAFNEVAQLLLGASAQSVSEFKDAGNEKAYEQVFKDANFKSYLFKCRAKLEQNKETGESRTRFHVIAATPINYKQECHFLLDEIAAYS